MPKQQHICCITTHATIHTVLGWHQLRHPCITHGSHAATTAHAILPKTHTPTSCPEAIQDSHHSRYSSHTSCEVQTQRRHVGPHHTSTNKPAVCGVCGSCIVQRHAGDTPAHTGLFVVVRTARDNATACCTLVTSCFQCVTLSGAPHIMHQARISVSTRKGSNNS